MLERGIGHRHHDLIGREAIGLDDDRPAFALCRVEQRTELFERDFLVAKINRRHGAAGDADDLLVDLRAKDESRKRQRNRNPGLQHEIRAEEQEKYQEKDDIEQRE